MCTSPLFSVVGAGPRIASEPGFDPTAGASRPPASALAAPRFGLGLGLGIGFAFGLGFESGLGLGTGLGFGLGSGTIVNSSGCIAGSAGLVGSVKPCANAAAIPAWRPNDKTMDRQATLTGFDRFSASGVAK